MNPLFETPDRPAWKLKKLYKVAFLVTAPCFALGAFLLAHNVTAGFFPMIVGFVVPAVTFFRLAERGERGGHL